MGCCCKKLQAPPTKVGTDYIARQIGPLTLIDIENKSRAVRLNSLWEEGPVLVHMFRRWGWSICRMGAADISAVGPQLRALGVRVVGIGPEELGFADFRAAGVWPYEVLLDAPKSTYRGLQLPLNTFRNCWGIVGGNSQILALAKKAKAEGHTNNLSGDTELLGGTILFAKGGVALYAFFQTPDDFAPDVPEMLRIAQTHLGKGPYVPPKA